MNLPFKFNWIDIIIILIFVRILYIATSRGFILEFFKMITTFFALFLSFHFYTHLSGLFVKAIRFAGKGGAACLSFVVIFSFIWFLFFFVRKGLTLLFKVESHALIEKWVCLFVGIARAVVCASLLCVCLLLCNVRYFDKSLEGSFSYYGFMSVSPKAYLIVARGCQRVFPRFRLNKEVKRIYEIT